MTYLDCPAYQDEKGAIRCGLPAEVRCRFTMNSTDGPLESAMIRCPSGHWFNGPIGFLTWQRTENHQPGDGGVTILRPNGAPAYYLGRPASLWIAALRPRREHTAGRTQEGPVRLASAQGGQTREDPFRIPSIGRPWPALPPPAYRGGSTNTGP